MSDTYTLTREDIELAFRGWHRASSTRVTQPLGQMLDISEEKWGTEATDYFVELLEWVRDQRAVHP